MNNTIDEHTFANNQQGMKFITVAMLAAKPDWWTGNPRFNSEDDMIDVAIGPLEVEHEGRSVWLDFTSAYLEITTNEDDITVGITLYDLNQWGTSELNGFDVDADTLRAICRNEDTVVKTVNCAEVLHIDMELAQFDGLELLRCRMATDNMEVHKKDITWAQLQC